MKFLLRMSIICLLPSSMIATMINRIPTLKPTLRQKSIKVITDIDDTVKSSGGVKIFGISLGGVDVSGSLRINQSFIPVKLFLIILFSLFSFDE